MSGQAPLFFVEVGFEESLNRFKLFGSRELAFVKHELLLLARAIQTRNAECLSRIVGEVAQVLHQKIDFC